MQNLHKLLSISSLGISPEISYQHVVRVFVELTATGQQYEELATLYSLRNGFFAFESSFWLYEVNSNQKYSLQKINLLPDLDPYRHQLNGGIVFASDAIGDQFYVNTQGYWSLNLETGESQWLAKSLNEWAAAILEDFECLTCFPLMHDWQIQNNVIKSGRRLCAKIPFVLGGEFAIENLYEVDLFELIGFKANLYQQIRDMPPDSEIKLNVID